MWDFFETVRHRHSVRRYQADMAVEEEKLHAILETACAAPSAGDLQSYTIHVVREPAARERLRAACPEDHTFVLDAPLSLVFSADGERSAKRFGTRGRALFAVQDATIAAAYAQLAAVAAGLASAWVGRFDAGTMRALLGLADTFEPVAMICVGYPAELPALTPRRRLDEIVRSL
jgi:nitroreductase